MTKDENLIRTLAQESLSEHILEKHDGYWACYKPRSPFYFFMMVFPPNCVFMYGDIGEAVLICSERKSMEWLRRSIGSMDYILGKSKFANRKRNGWSPQDYWHYFAMVKFCDLLGETDAKNGKEVSHAYE